MPPITCTQNRVLVDGRRHRLGARRECNAKRGFGRHVACQTLWKQSPGQEHHESTAYVISGSDGANGPPSVFSKLLYVPGRRVGDAKGVSEDGMRETARVSCMKVVHRRGGGPGRQAPCDAAVARGGGSRRCVVRGVRLANRRPGARSIGELDGVVGCRGGKVD